MLPQLSPLIVVLGPTGTGKSALALTLAERFHGEIVNCDSVQVYRRLDLGTAKVPAFERRAIKHHLIDVLDLHEELSAGAYSRLARATISEIQQNQHVPIIVGGSGFYLRALLEGLPPVPQSDSALRRRLILAVRRKPGILYRFLRRFNPEACTRIHPNDEHKLIRAAEITISAARAPHEQEQASQSRLAGVSTLKIGLNPSRAELYAALNARATRMFADGLISETQTLLDSGLSPQLKPFTSLGYKQAVKVIFQNASREQAIEECQTMTRRYAKRQLTWFRREPGVAWIDGFGTKKWVQDEALRIAQEFMSQFPTSAGMATTKITGIKPG